MHIFRTYSPMLGFRLSLSILFFTFWWRSTSSQQSVKLIILWKNQRAIYYCNIFVTNLLTSFSQSCSQLESCRGSFAHKEGTGWLVIAWAVTGRRIFQLYRIQFSNTGAYGGLYTRLSQLSWHLQKLPIHSSRRFQHDLTVAWTCYVTETEYSPRFHDIPCVSISWIDAFPSSSKHFHEVPTLPLGRKWLAGSVHSNHHPELLE